MRGTKNSDRVFCFMKKEAVVTLKTRRGELSRQRSEANYYQLTLHSPRDRVVRASEDAGEPKTFIASAAQNNGRGRVGSLVLVSACGSKYDKEVS